MIYLTKLFTTYISNTTFSIVERRSILWKILKPDSSCFPVMVLFVLIFIFRRLNIFYINLNLFIILCTVNYRNIINLNFNKYIYMCVIAAPWTHLVTSWPHFSRTLAAPWLNLVVAMLHLASPRYSLLIFEVVLTFHIYFLRRQILHEVAVLHGISVSCSP